MNLISYLAFIRRYAKKENWQTVDDQTIIFSLSRQPLKEKDSIC